MVDHYPWTVTDSAMRKKMTDGSLFMDVPSTGSMQRTDTQSRDHGKEASIAFRRRPINCFFVLLSATVDRSIYVIIKRAMHISLRQFQLFLVVERPCKDFFLSPWKDENAENIMSPSPHYRYEAKTAGKKLLNEI